MPKSNDATRVAQVHVHFNIQATTVETGDVAPAEQIAAVERFIRWHERQVAVGKRLLQQLAPQSEAESNGRPLVD